MDTNYYTAACRLEGSFSQLIFQFFFFINFMKIQAHSKLDDFLTERRFLFFLRRGALSMVQEVSASLYIY